jgi:dipeptidyl aminopeptidase/acylaminoacyl peptidase
LGSSAQPRCFINEETSWRAQPEVAPDGRRVLYSSYQGRQWHQLWLTTLAGDAPLPLTFGDFDATAARWSPDGRRIAYISNESGNLRLWVHEVVGGARTPVDPRNREYSRPMAQISIELKNAAGQRVNGRVSVLGADNRYYAPENARVHADDGFDPHRQPSEVRYFHCLNGCSVMAPVGEVEVVAWRGQQYTPVWQRVQVKANAANVVTATLRELNLPDWAPVAATADLHVHNNYGGLYRNDAAALHGQMEAEDLDAVYNLIVNKEQRIPDIDRVVPAQAGTQMDSRMCGNDELLFLS